MEIRKGLSGSIGNSPIIELENLSKLTGSKIWGKAEFMNSLGSIKDRAAYYILKTAQEEGKLDGEYIVEGTAGNTGISLCMIANSMGKKSIFCCPDYISIEKIEYLRRLGATVHVCPVVPMSDPNHFQTKSKSIAKELNGFYCDQFDNLNNLRAHYETTGPEIWKQTEGKVDIITFSSGTGGTLAGTSKFLKEKKDGILVVPALTQSQVVVPWEKRGNKFGWRDMTDEEKQKRKYTNSLTEGIGSGRLYKNLEQSEVDDSLIITDVAAVNMCHFVLRYEGLFLGSSAGLNLVSACLTSFKYGKNKNIVTLLCDSGKNYASRLFDKEALEKLNIPITIKGENVKEDFKSIFNEELFSINGIKFDINSI
eukprot:TRINITY_DN5040_c0_g1_i1.p1 TRINITY_DN5040_c0_g1~~TRINITY_DN5040_c0_g1_i1.p1  ORF type:complete len:367 (-),score=108.44 TRINITY_DN5040_c0_g1_i1:24-1124(-)